MRSFVPVDPVSTGNAVIVPPYHDVNRTAWDVFTRSIDRTELEKERMRAVNLDEERFGSDAHKAQMWLHEVARVESRRAMSFAHVPYRFTDWERTRG